MERKLVLWGLARFLWVERKQALALATLLAMVEKVADTADVVAERFELAEAVRP